MPGSISTPASPKSPHASPVMPPFSTFLSLVSLLVTLTPVIAAIPAASPPSTLSETLSNVSNNATGSSGKPLPRTYRVPDTPTTLYFYKYSNPAGLKTSAVYHTLVTSLNSVYHSAIRPSRTGDSLIGVDHVTWRFSGANIFIENHGLQGTNKLTWTMLADTLLGIGALLNDLECLQGQWTISDDVLGNIGTGYVGKDVWTGAVD
ncbi:hypothetical protein N7G274_001554 [Stereocaulon virgatum]|uniref:Uncharacterized protein n=1 Tax=Stereocaulon virgatum TaxID=373712 RepID=A0ABR4AK06_9LECA